MYYVIEHVYVGPNPDQNTDADYIEVASKPARTNSSNEIQINGWCGTTNDWSVIAHGEYTTEYNAIAAIKEIYGEFRGLDDNGDPFEETRYFPMDDSVIRVFKPGKYHPLSCESTSDLAYDGMYHYIQSDTTDAELNMLAYDWEAEMNANGYSYHEDLLDMMIEYRKEMKDSYRS